MFSLKVDTNIELGFYTEQNAEEIYNIVKENYEHLHQWSPWLDENYSLEKQKDFARLCIKQYSNKETLPLGIFVNGKYVGGTGFHNIDLRYKTTEIGYWLAEKYNGKGIVTKSCRTLLEYAFGELGLNRIIIRCVPENLKSRAIPENLGFTNEGIERQGGLHHGKFVDFVVYSMLAEEWRKVI